MINMLFGESLIGGANVNSSMDLQSIGSLLEMSSQNVESSLLPNFRSSNGIITSIWIGSLCVEMMTSYISSKKATSRGFAFKTLKICYCFWLRKADKSHGVKSYQKMLNLTKLDTYRSNLKRKEAYTTYSNPRGFIYHNKVKQNMLMRFDELHKFSDGMLNDVRTALDDRLKDILRQILHSNTLETIIQSSSNIIEHPIAEFVQFIKPHQHVLLDFIMIDESSWIGVSGVSFLALEIGTRDVEIKALFDREICQLFLTRSSNISSMS
nr:hypothetical protein [Tanacetum cinerariifolium]